MKKNAVCVDGYRVPSKDEIKKNLREVDAWATRAVEYLFTKQTASEQAIEHTVYHNGVGFSAADADILSSFAKQLKRGRKMSEKQMFIIKKRVPKYWLQIQSAIIEKHGGLG